MAHLEKANNMYNKLLGVAGGFISPSIKDFFVRKANNDYNALKERCNLDKKTLDMYVEKQNELLKSLTRTVGIYNMYNDGSSTL